MRKDDIISKINFILDEGCRKELQLFGFVAGDDNVYKINVSNELEGELIKLVASGVQSLLVDRDYDIVDFSSADERKDKYFLYDLNNVPERMAQMSVVIGNHNVRSFDLQHNSIDEINTLIMLLSDGNGSAFTIYKVLSPVEKVVKSTKMILARIGIGEDFLTEESKPLLRIGPRFQIVFFDSESNEGEGARRGNYIFLESSSVEGQFKLDNVLKNEAAQKLEIMEGTHLVKDLTKIRHYAETPAFCRKLVKVLRNSKVIRENISKERIFEFISGDEELRSVLPVAEVDGERYLDINSQKSAQKLLDLLNDEFVYSSLTNQKYQSVYKDER